MASRDWPPEHTLNWTPRQREVLQLIAAGRTNPEIAETLGVSLAGAKWHVSEVISKLGVSCREQAAEYWRETNSVSARLSRGMSALAGLVTLKTAAGAVAAVTVVGAMAVGVATLTGSGAAGDDELAATTITPTSLPTPPDMYVPADASPRCSGEPSRQGVSIALREVAGLELLLAGFRDDTDRLCLRLFGYPTNPPGSMSWGGFGWPSESDDNPPGCGGVKPSNLNLPFAIVCRATAQIDYVEVVVDGSATRLPAAPLPDELNSTFKYIFATFDGSAQSVQVRFFDETGNLVNETDIPWVNREDPPFGPPPAMTEHITAVSPAHGETVSQADTPAGACASATFEGLPGQGTWFRLQLDGADVTALAVWTIDLPLPPSGGKLCYSPAAGLEPGRHTATVEVRDPNDTAAPALETVTWSFEVIP
jgi:DNA-binding CsgD family transcriptional regulator